MLESRKTQHVFVTRTMTAQQEIDKILELHRIKTFASRCRSRLHFMGDNMNLHKTQLAYEFLEGKNICRLNWPARSSNF